MKVSKKLAFELLTVVGFKNLGGIKDDATKLAEKLQGLYEVTQESDIKKVKDPAMQKLLKQVCKAGEAEEEIEVADDKEKPAKAAPAPSKNGKGKKAAVVEEDDEDEESDDDEETETEEEDEEESDDEESEEGEPDEEESDDEEDEEEDDQPAPKKKGKAAVAVKAAPKKGEKVVATKKTVVKEKVVRESSAEKDPLGSRVGSRANRVNMAMAVEPKAAAEIQEDADADSNIGGHLRWLQGYRNDGLTGPVYIKKVKTDDGLKYALTSLGAKKLGKAAPAEKPGKTVVKKKVKK